MAKAKAPKAPKEPEVESQEDGDPDAPVAEAADPDVTAAVGKQIAKGKPKAALDTRVAALETRIKDVHNDLVEVVKVVSQMVGGAAAAKLRDIMTRHAGHGR